MAALVDAAFLSAGTAAALAVASVGLSAAAS